MKTVSKRATKLIIEVTTRELYDAFHACSLDIVWGEQCGRERHNSAARMLAGLERLIDEGEENIRAMFRDGDTYLLVPGATGELENHDCVEIKVTRSDKTSFLIENADIQF